MLSLSRNTRLFCDLWSHYADLFGYLNLSSPSSYRNVWFIRFSRLSIHLLTSFPSMTPIFYVSLFFLFSSDNLRLFMKFLVIFVRSLNNLFNCSVGTSFHKIESVQFHSLLSLEIFKSFALCEWSFFHDLIVYYRMYIGIERDESPFFYKIDFTNR